MSSRRLRKNGAFSSSQSQDVGSERNDVSFLDTEPMTFEELSGVEVPDTSLLDTEPMDEDQDGMTSGRQEASAEDDLSTDCEEEEEEDASSDGQNDNDEDENLENRGHRQRVSQANSLALSGMDSEEDESILGDSPFDITHAPSHEVKRVYSELIDSCRDFDGTLQNHNTSRKILKEQISHGRTLFDQLENSMAMNDSQNESSSRPRTSPGPGRRLGNAASDIYMACLHTRACTNMLHKKAKQIGAVANKFKLDEFLELLKAKNTDEDGNYSSSLASQMLATQCGISSFGAPASTFILGSFDREVPQVEATATEAQTQKEPKLRRRKDENDPANATQTEILTQNNKADKDNTEADFVKEIVKLVKTKSAEKGGNPINLLETAFNRGEDLHSALRRLFGISFAVRDGRLELDATAAEQTEANSNSGSVGIEGSNRGQLLLKPEKPPVRNKSGHDNAERRQTIISFTAGELKELLQKDGFWRQ